MKKLTFLTALIFSVMFSSTSFADWTKVSENVDGRTFYVDFDRIRKHDGFVYFWELTDYLKPTQSGYLSDKLYAQVECEVFRYKSLTGSFHKEPMGRGTGDSNSLKNPEWNYPFPNTPGEIVLKKVCKYAK